ncbi:hypothetical protein L218DRAFT_875077 [Marasmius fiardii PR-910]|nr:hypothetical protein L218DRAFT_875077 [Marasmius fiardii PR-910]
MDRIGRQVGEFLAQFIENKNIPKATSDNTRGGISIVGWSLGCSSAMALFSNLRLVPPETYFKLEPYVKHLVLYEPPPFCFGYPLPIGPEFYLPFSDPDLKTPDAMFEAFSHWVSSIIDHPDINSANHSGMDTRTKRSDDTTVAKWSPKQIQKYSSRDAFHRSELPMFGEPMQATLKKMSESVLYDKEMIDTYFPDLKLTLIGGTKSCWLLVFSNLETRRIYDRNVEEGVAARPMRTYEIDGGNHFVSRSLCQQLDLLKTPTIRLIGKLQGLF